MNIYVALSLFSVVILLYFVVSELFTMLFRFTGLPAEKARFQVVSLLTGCGFTTRESELLLTTKSRRRLARVTMLFGYVFNITIVSMLINVFVSIKLSTISNYFSILIPLFVGALIIIFARVPKVRAWGDRLIERIAGKVAHIGESNSVLLMDYLGEDSVAQVTLRKVPEAYVEKTLSQSGLKPEHNILVLLIERPGQKAKPAGARTVFQDGDKLTVYGNYREICRVFEATEQFEETEEE